MKLSDQSKLNTITLSGVIAGSYVVLTYMTSVLGLSSGVIQLRISEALCALALFNPAGIYGTTIGCFISNIISGGILIDVIFGTLATFTGTFLCYYLRKKPYLGLFMPVLSNTLIIPFVLAYAYGSEESLGFIFFTIFIGEGISVYLLGLLLRRQLLKFQ